MIHILPCMHATVEIVCFFRRAFHVYLVHPIKSLNLLTGNLNPFRMHRNNLFLPLIQKRLFNSKQIWLLFKKQC